MKNNTSDILFHVSKETAEWPCVSFVTKKYWEKENCMSDELPVWAQKIVDKFITLYDISEQENCKYDLLYEYEDMKQKLISYGFSQSDSFNSFLEALE